MNSLVGSSVTSSEVLPEIADHVLIRRIGKGAYGEVWLARNVMGGYHAVKVVYRRTFMDERPYLREFEGICKFEPLSRNHHGLVTILHVGQNLAAGHFYYVMELADDARTGQEIDTETYVPRTLAQVMKAEQRLPLEERLQIGLSLASALAYLHAQKLIHRDIKPSNIIFVHGQPRLADIGLITKEGQELTSVGTWGYMAPEGPGEAGDIFALGKVFYGLFLGMPVERFPEAPGEAEEYTTVPALRQLNNLVLKACEYDKTLRIQSANELHEALLAIADTLHGNSDSMKPVVKPGPRVSLPEDRPEPEKVRPDAKARWPRMVALLMLLLAVTGGLLFTYNHPPVVVLIDTTARRGIYEEANKDNGRSNAKDLYDIIHRVVKEIPPENVYEMGVDSGWARQDFVLSRNPDLLIIHRSVFFHPAAAALKFPYPPFETSEEQHLFEQRYKILGDDKLWDFLGFIGTASARTRFLVYSRGTDTNWLSASYRETWIKELAIQYPSLAGRVTTMLVPGNTNGTFNEPKTMMELIRNVRTILKLPEKNRNENSADAPSH